MSRLQGSAAPPNPETTNNRVNPRVEYLEGLARVRKSLETLIEKTDESSQMIEQKIFGAMHYAVMKLLSGIDPTQVISGITQSLQPPIAPGGGAPPQQAPTPPMGPQPPNPALQAALGGGSPAAPPVASLGG